MTNVAVITIVIGHEVNGEFQRVTIKPNDVLPSWVSQKDVQALLKSGACTSTDIESYPQTKKRAVTGTSRSVK